MEEVKSAIRPYKVSGHYKQSLKDGTEYYRVTLQSEFKSVGSTNTDAVFNVGSVFPNLRADLMNGRWYAFLENFHGVSLETQIAKGHIKVCLPGIIQNSHDFVMTARDVCQVSDTLAHVPNPFVSHHDDSVDILPVVFSQEITDASVGKQINPTNLFTGELRVVMRNEDHSTIEVDDVAGTPHWHSNEKWTATLLFVHHK